MAPAIDIMDGCSLSKKRVVNTCHRIAILVVHFIVGGAAILMVNLGALQCTEVSGHTIPVAKHLKTKARLQLHSKSFGLKQLSNSFK